MSTPIERDALLRDLTSMLNGFEPSGNGEINIFIRNGKPVAIWDTKRPPLHFYVAGLSEQDYKAQRVAIAKEQHATLKELDDARECVIAINKFVSFVKSLTTDRDAATKRIDALLSEGGAK